MTIDWLTRTISETHSNIAEPIYSLSEAYDKYEVRELIPETAWLILNWDESNKEERLWLKFAVLEFLCSKMNYTNIETTIVFHGDGPSTTLRECRHTHWGHDGYIFYPKAKIIAAAFKELSKFFDEMEIE